MVHNMAGCTAGVPEQGIASLWHQVSDIFTRASKLQSLPSGHKPVLRLLGFCLRISDLVIAVEAKVHDVGPSRGHRTKEVGCGSCPNGRMT